MNQSRAQAAVEQYGSFDYQEPMQDLFFVGPKVGVVAQWPVFCANDQTG
jgi:hypothetical protein